MSADPDIIDSDDFQELTLRFIIANGAARKALGARIVSIADEPVLDTRGEMNPHLTKTLLVGGLQDDPTREAEASMLFLSERFLAADRTLNTRATLIATHLHTVVDDMSQLKPYFGPRSGYEETARTSVIEKINAFLETAARLGFTPREAGRGTRSA